MDVHNPNRDDEDAAQSLAPPAALSDAGRRAMPPTSAERERFRIRAREASDAPDCSDVAPAFLRDARDLMKRYPDDGEIAVVVAKEALRLRNDDYAWEAMHVLDGPVSQADRLRALLEDEPSRASVLGISEKEVVETLTQLREAGFDAAGGDGNFAESRFRAAILDAASILNGVKWDPLRIDSDMRNLALETAVHLGDSIGRELPWIAQEGRGRMLAFESTVERVLAAFRGRHAAHPLKDVVLEGLLARIVAERESAPAGWVLAEVLRAKEHGRKLVELQLVEEICGRHARARWLARLATTHAFDKVELLRRAVDVTRQLRTDGGKNASEYFSDTEASALQKDVLLCAELARAYVRTGSPIYSRDPAWPLKVPDPSPDPVRERPVSFDPPSSKQPRPIQPLEEIVEWLFPDFQVRAGLCEAIIRKAIVDERERVARGHPSGLAEFGNYPFGWDGNARTRTPAGSQCGEPLVPPFSDAEHAVMRGDGIAAKALLHGVFTDMKGPPADLIASRWRCLFDLAIRADDLELAEAVLDEMFTLETSRQRWTHGHALDALVATLAEALAGRGNPRSAECLVRKYMERGASSLGRTGIAKGRVNFALESRSTTPR
jgi:hypothetical protein